MNNPEAKTGEIMPKESDAATEERKKILAVTRGWIADDKLSALRAQFKNITAVTTTKGYKECVKAIGVVRRYRTKLEKSRLEKNRVDHEKISIRNKEAKRILAILVEIETPLKEMRRVEDERIAKEKAEEERVEKERIDAIKQRIEDNFGQHQIDDLAGKPSAYMEARMRIIEAYDVDDSYQEFQGDARFLKVQLLDRIRRIVVAKREQEQADKQLQAEKAKLDAEKQKMAAEAKRLEEQQEAFEKERSEWRAKRAAEAEACQAVEEDPAKEPAQEHTPEGTVCAEAAEEAQGDKVTELLHENGAESAEFPRIDFSKEEEEAQTNRERLIELIQEETGINEFNDEDITALLDLAKGMYLGKKFDGPIRYLAGQVRKELELYDQPE